MRAAPFAPTPLSVVPLTLGLIGLSLLAWSIPGILRGHTDAPVRNAPAARPAAPIATDPPTRAAELQRQLEETARAREILKDRLDSISHDAATAQWLLAMVLGIAGLLTLAQGVFAFFSAQNYVKQADDAIARANQAIATALASAKESAENGAKAVARIDELAADVRAKYPMFADIESARLEAFNQLSGLTANLDDNQNLYAESDPLMRQKIFAIESFCAIQFLTPANRSAELLGNLRLLGKFYAGKFASERQLSSDFERSQYYFELALEKFGRPYTVLNDIGWLFSTVTDRVDLDRARAALEESLRRKPNQQRALFDLASIAFERGDRARLEASLGFLLQAKRQTTWEDRPNARMASHIDYNLACTYDALAELTGDAADRRQMLDRCMESFEAAAKIGGQVKAIVDSDLQGGDLSNLASSAAHADRLKTAVAMYELAWQRP
jgi:hypothetical protein